MRKSPEEIRQKYLETYPGKTGELAHYLSDQISFLHIKWNEYRELFGNEPETIEMVNEVAPYFFWMYERILRHDVLSTISRLLDPAYTGRNPNNSNASFSKLLHDLEKYVDKNAIIEEWKSDLIHLKDSSQKVLEIRNKMLSHNDFDIHVTHSAEILPSISRQKIEDTLQLIRDFSNKIQKHFKNSTTAYDYIFPPIEGTKSLLAFIENNIEK